MTSFKPMFLKLTIKFAQGLLNTMPSLFIVARDSKKILKGQVGYVKDRPIKKSAFISV